MVTDIVLLQASHIAHLFSQLHHLTWSPVCTTVTSKCRLCESDPGSPSSSLLCPSFVQGRSRNLEPVSSSTGHTQLVRSCAGRCRSVPNELCASIRRNNLGLVYGSPASSTNLLDFSPLSTGLLSYNLPAVQLDSSSRTPCSSK